MEFLNTPHKKKSAGLTAIFAVLFLSLFFVLGLTYYDPPVSYGMEVNFGTSTKGSGNQQPQELVESKPAVVAKNTVEKTQVNTTQPPPKSIKVGNEMYRYSDISSLEMWKKNPEIAWDLRLIFIK